MLDSQIFFYVRFKSSKVVVSLCGMVFHFKFLENSAAMIQKILMPVNNGYPRTDRIFVPIRTPLIRSLSKK